MFAKESITIINAHTLLRVGDLNIFQNKTLLDLEGDIQLFSCRELGR